MNSSGEPSLSLCGPLSGQSCYSQPWDFPCVALEVKGNTDRAFDPQMPLAQSPNLGGGLACSLSPTLHIQLVRRFSRPLSQSMSRSQPLLTTFITTTLAKIPTATSWTVLLSSWPLCFHPGSLTCLFSTQQQRASQIISLLFSTPHNSGLKPTNMFKGQEFIMTLINNNNNKEEPYLENAGQPTRFQENPAMKGKNSHFKGSSKGMWSTYGV